MKPTLEERFWSRVKKRQCDECWDWTATKNADGYGRIWANGRFQCAHRFMFEITQGPIPAQMHVDHICNNKGCVNPVHLRLASAKENSKNRSLNKNSGSGFKGVTFNKRRQRWIARIQIDGKRVVLGLFNTAETAYLAYCEAAVAFHGEFANLGQAKLSHREFERRFGNERDLLAATLVILQEF